jgi:hypothetical protein
VINQALPRQIFANKDKDRERTPACASARIEFFDDETARRLLQTETYGRLRVLDPKRLKPWPLGGTIFDTNPHIDKDHFMATHCHGPFWVRNYCQQSKQSGYSKQEHVFCRMQVVDLIESDASELPKVSSTGSDLDLLTSSVDFQSDNF